MQIFFLIVAGFAAGIIGGMGMGGGTILIPILTILLGLSQQIAQSINLLSFLPMAVISILLHIKNKLINFKVVLPFIICGVVCSVVGGLIAVHLDKMLLRKLFGVFIILVAAFQIIMMIFERRKEKRKGEQSPKEGTQKGNCNNY